MVSINATCAQHTAGSFLSTDIPPWAVCVSGSGSGVPPGLGSPAAPKPDPVPAPAWSRGSSGWCSRDDAIQEMQVPFHSTAPTFPSAARLFSGSQQRHSGRTEGWVPASPHTGLPPVTRVPVIPGDPNLRLERPWLLLKSSLHHW